ncbi:hypothetical protein ACFW04_000683 [Cataglyphis niger]
MNDDVEQSAAKDVASTVEHHVMDILNPTLHHHDLLQSYVRTRVEIGVDSKQDVEEIEESTKEARSSKYPAKVNGSDNCRYDGKKKRNDDRTKKERSNITNVESEMRIQKSRKK